ncbi:MAG: D-alanine--D-alanine ligase [Clostridiales bacterium]|nr:D-alanine--D-alanine ligase [Clostridiales bacterium]MCF8021989.1 D-alanine--D-alanine ligase [Clostridiales bacterium]
MNTRIGILMGGRSAEKDVSMRTGEAVYKALINSGHQAEKIIVDYDIAQKLQDNKLDLAFIALHGKYGEDGTIQGLLEMLDIPYTGSSVLTSSLCMDKISTKKILIYEKLPTPNFTVIENKLLDTSKVIENILSQHKIPLVVKAPTQGSTIGTSFVYKEEQLLPALQEAFKYDSHALIEELIDGSEITASIIGNRDPVALPLIEIVSKTGVYDYKSKYTAGLSDHIIPPRISIELQEKIKDLALKTYKSLGCRGFSRVDFMVDSINKKPTILEVNTIPGMTETSLVPDAAKSAGISFENLIEKIVFYSLE